MTQVEIFVWPKCDGLESSSGFCLKAIYACRVKKIPFTIRDVSFSAFPKWISRGKLPAAIVHGKKIQDSTHILSMIASEFGPGSLFPSDQQAKLECKVWEDWADEVLRWFVVYYRWANDEGWAHFFAEGFGKAPFPAKFYIKKVLRKQVIKSCFEFGIAHETEEKRRQMFDDYLQLFDLRLAKSSFFFGDNITAADIAIFAHLKIILNGNYGKFAPRIAEHKSLSQWTDRMWDLVKP